MICILCPNLYTVFRMEIGHNIMASSYLGGLYNYRVSFILFPICMLKKIGHNIIASSYLGGYDAELCTQHWIREYRTNAFNKFNNINELK